MRSDCRLILPFPGTNPAGRVLFPVQPPADLVNCFVAEQEETTSSSRIFIKILFQVPKPSPLNRYLIGESLNPKP